MEGVAHPLLFAKGFARALGIGYFATLRDAFPLRSPRGPLQTNNKDVAWLFQSLLFLFVSLLLCKPEYAYKQKKGFSQS